MKSMKNMKMIGLLFLLLSASGVIAQEDEPNDFELGDDLFDLEFLDAGETAQDQSSAWYVPFTYKLSYQTISQVNEHVSTDFLGNDVDEQPELENNRLSLLAKYQHTFAPGWLLQGNAHAKLYLRQDYEYEANNNNTHTEFRLNELFLQHSFDQHSLKVGNQTVVWGEADGNSVLDVINTTEIRDLSIVNIEDARLNQFFVVWDRFGDRSSLSSFVNLYPKFNPALKPGSPLYQPLLYKRVDLDRDKILLEAGTQYRWTRTGSDIAVMAAYLYENQLRYDPPPSQVGNAIPVENDFWLLGMSANKAIDKLLLVADFSYSNGVFADTFDPTAFTTSRYENNLVGTSLGFEYGVSALQQVSFSLRAESYLDQSVDEAGQQLINDDVFGTYLLRYSYNSNSGDIALSSTLQRDFDGVFLLGSVGLNYVVNDNWSWFSQIVVTDADAGGPFFLDDDARVELTVNYSF